MRRSFFITCGLLAIFAAGTLYAQPPLFPESRRDEDPPRSVRESLDRMRIEHEKKEYAEMLKRGEDAARITADIENLFALNGRLSGEDVSKLAEVEKLVRKIRSELGGSDGDDDEEEGEIERPTTSKEAVATLNKNAASLYEDLKRTSRFAISATAIQSANAILKVARFLKIVN